MVADGISIVSTGIDQPHSVMVAVPPVICKLVPTCNSCRSFSDPTDLASGAMGPIDHGPETADGVGPALHGFCSKLSTGAGHLFFSSFTTQLIDHP